MSTQIYQQQAGSAKQFEIGCLIAVRLCIAAFALLAVTAYAVYVKPINTLSSYSIYTPIAWLFGMCLLSAIWLAWKKTNLTFITLQFLADSTLVIFSVWITGQLNSPLLFLLIPIVAGAGLLAGKKIACAVTAYAFTLYFGLVGAVHIGLLMFAGHSHIINLSTSSYVLVIGLFVALITVAFGADHIRRLAYAALNLADKNKQALIELEQSNQALVNDLLEGIITTDLNDAINFVNQAALQILRLDEAKISGVRLTELLTTKFPEFVNSSHAKSFELFGKQDQTDLHISMRKKPIISTQGETSGWLYLFQDISKLRDMESQLEWQNKLVQSDTTTRAEQFHSLVSEFVGETPVMQKIFRIITKVAAADANVLIAGESGTGKELVARSLHKGSKRFCKPFVAVNCGAIPENLIESQLFGHKKGSFTGADYDHKGFFLEASGGTIFLDEIGELPLALQAKLLRVIQEKVVRPVGGDKDLPIDVRIVSATNRQLKVEVIAGRFREDLFYRLNVININVPPLRERKEDLPILINSLLKHHVKSDRIPTVTPASMQILMRYNYPGNIRELENILERAIVLGGEIILPEHLPDQLLNVAVDTVTNQQNNETQIICDENLMLPLNLDQLLNGIEFKYIQAALSKSKGVKKEAARLLGINFRSFRYRLQKFEDSVKPD